VTENVTGRTKTQAEMLDMALQRAFDNIARDPTVATYLEGFSVEDRDRALLDIIFEKLSLRVLEDWPTRLGRLSSGVFFGNDPTP
jgi:hypothetical protein